MLIPQTNPRHSRGQCVWFAVWVAVTAVGLYLKADPHGHGTHQALGLPPCPSVLLLNRPCPGCGLTTSWTALLHGDFALAFSAHPLGPLLYLIYTATAFLSLYLAVKRLQIDPRDRRTDRLAMLGVGIFFVFGVVRLIRTPNYQTDRESVIASILKGR